MASGQATPQVEDPAPRQVAPVPQVAQVPLVGPVPQVAQVPLVAQFPQAYAPMGFFIVTAMQAYPGTEPYMSLKVLSSIILVWGL